MQLKKLTSVTLAYLLQTNNCFVFLWTFPYKLYYFQIRVAASADPDYVELELPREAMTLEYLTVAACEELGVEADQVTKST